MLHQRAKSLLKLQKSLPLMSKFWIRNQLRIFSLKMFKLDKTCLKMLTHHIIIIVKN